MVKFNNLILWLSYASAIAQVTPTTVRVTNEIAPPGGMVQIKVLLTSPKPITTGNMWVDFSSGFFDSVDGIALFSNTGDVVGAAVVDNDHFNVRLTSPHGTFGTNTDYPLLTAAFRLSASVVPGQKFEVKLDPSQSMWQDLLGSTFPIEVQQGSITVGGSVSITDVVPGGGMLSAGAAFSIFGMGFSPNTKIAVRGIGTQAINYVSPTEFRVMLREGGMLDGVMIQAQNPDKSADTYYSYMRGVPMGVSTRSLLAKTVPVFSLLTATEAIIPSTISPDVNPDYYTGIALQNPSATTAQLAIEARSGAGTLLGSTSASLPNHARFTREYAELFGFTLPTGAYVRVVSSQPVQVLGLLCAQSTQNVQPIAATIVAGPPAPTPPPVTTSGGGGGGGGKGSGTP
jgi:hypothetical protein